MTGRNRRFSQEFKDEAVRRTWGPSADSAFISSLGIPTVLFGPSGEGAHADVEWVSIADTVACAKVLVSAAAALSRT
ncbi:M20/M25/M40 family metallo-hydrolase [Microtetraspora fusca]|uniref:M20/M25/M40 family metallo-hydrolase n=1 Tax=Microtetraspora fusca TaxID=1997 RepID=UPI000B310BA7|nr:M20/M25/M40 family metallo-hydrolase [Microtetraspora fusca]